MCLVVRGCNQKEGINFNEVFSPIVRHTSIRVLLPLLALFELELEQMDFKLVLLHDGLEKEIYMKQAARDLWFPVRRNIYAA